MRIRTIAGTMAGTAVACLALTTPASAAVTPPDGGSWDYSWTTSDSLKGGTVYIQKHGDTIAVCDTAADGLSARANVGYQLEIGGQTFNYPITASGGNGTCAYHDASEGGIYDLPEGYTINVKVGLGPDLDHDVPGSFVNDR